MSSLVPIRAQVSQPAWRYLLNKADLNPQHPTASARGIGPYVSHLLLTTTFQDARPQYLIDAERGQIARFATNLQYWGTGRFPRIPRNLKLSPDAVVAAVRLAEEHDIRPGQATANATIGALLELIGLQILQPTSRTPDFINPQVNQSSRSRYASRSRASAELSARRAEAYIERGTIL